MAKEREKGKRKREREIKKGREKWDRRGDGGEWVRGEGERETLVAMPGCFRILWALLQDLSLAVVYIKGEKRKRCVCN